MIVIRPIRNEDIEDFVKIAFFAGSGMTSMPKNRALLERKVIESERSFIKDVLKPGFESYLFVLEDLSTGLIGGTCGIVAKSGPEHSKCFFSIRNEENHSQSISASRTISLMLPVYYSETPSEIGSLYLMPEFRSGGLGKLLSLSRLLFTASHPERFTDTIFAEMRGFVKTNGTSPFWEGVCRHFLNIDYEELSRLRDLGNTDFSEALPKYPIYIPLLPKKVQNSIGRVHANTEPAFRLLQEEGFQKTNEIDIFDGGPKIQAETKAINTIKTSCKDFVVGITDCLPDKQQYIVCNQRLDFRACYCPLQKNNEGVNINRQSAEALNVQIGDPIRYVLLHHEKSKSLKRTKR